MGKLKDLWSSENRTKAINSPQPVRVARGWNVTPEVVPANPEGPRKRKYIHIKPNKRDAVALPIDGQSYNPSDETHQKALDLAVKQLGRKKKQFEKFAAEVTYGRDSQYRGNLSSDKTWDDDEVEEGPTQNAKKRIPGVIGQARATTTKGSKNKKDNKKKKEDDDSSSSSSDDDDNNNNNDGGVSKSQNQKKKSDSTSLKKKAKKSKKRTKKERMYDRRRALVHRRHPDRGVVAEEADELDEILEEHAETMEMRAEKREKHRKAVADGLTIRSFGRYHYQPLALDVAPSSKLVGSLRHMSGSYVHPALDRFKSLEERNMIPARMQHKFNKRKLLKGKGQLRVKREDFGILPRTDF